MSDSGRTLSDPCEKCRTFHNGPCKPAATGSGEPLLADQRCRGCGKRYQEHAGHDNLCYTDGRTLTFVPTPPASQPTVTLSREDYDNLCDGLSGLARFADYDSDRMTLRSCWLYSEQQSKSSRPIANRDSSGVQTRGEQEMSTAHDQFMQKYQALSLKQQRWLRGKARWERMSLMAVLNDWTPPEDSKLTPCGAAVCYGCELCKPTPRSHEI